MVGRRGTQSLDDAVALLAEAGEDALGVLLAAGLELDVDLDLVEVELRGDPLVRDLEDVGAVGGELGQQVARPPGESGMVTCRLR